MLAYQLLKPTLKKVGEKIADKISDKIIEDGAKAFILIETALKEVFYRLIPKSQPVTTIFNYPGNPHIQLIAKTRNYQLLLKAIFQISNVLNKIDNLKKMSILQRFSLFSVIKGNGNLIICLLLTASR